MVAFPAPSPGLGLASAWNERTDAGCDNSNDWLAKLDVSILETIAAYSRYSSHQSPTWINYVVLRLASRLVTVAFVSFFLAVALSAESPFFTKLE